MKYYVEYPCLILCGLKCGYCFHSEHYEKNDPGYNTFTVQDWIKFRETHLKDAEEIVLHFHGGEPFYGENVSYIDEFMKESTVEKIDFLSNGLGFKQDYLRILTTYKERIHRIGFTYHRKMIENVPSKKATFEENVLNIKSIGIPIYVKELLFVDEIEVIKANKQKWESMGISFKVQDFKGWDRGRSFEEHSKYTFDTIKMIDPDYLHLDQTICACKKGYKNVKIRGGCLAWQHSGDVIVCWEDPKVIGSIQNNEFNPNYKITKPKGIVNVECDGAEYKGTYEKDLYVSKGITG